MLVSFNWLKDFVDISVSPKQLAERLTMGGFEVESILESDGDTVFDINIMPNRGDCLSVVGIAREVAAILGKACRADVLAPVRDGVLTPKRLSARAPVRRGAIKDYLSVENLDQIRCPRYAAHVIEGVKIGPSPEWLVKRLTSCGVRAINNVVDATNYVMLETGQPFHAFDARFIRGKKIIVKTLDNETEFQTLDGITRKLDREDLLICDAEGPIALAGVMGGANSEVRTDTAVIILESAYFDPVAVRRTSKRLGLSSESSTRFERGIDSSKTLENLERLTQLIVSLAGGQPSKDYIDNYPRPFRPVKIKFNHSEIARLLGVDVKQAEAKKLLSLVGVRQVGDSYVVPTWRGDLRRPADLVEEVIRLYGYDKILAALPEIEMSYAARPVGYRKTAAAKQFLVSNGFYEAINLGFTSKGDLEPFSKEEPIVVSNPLGVEFSRMKTSLIPGLLSNLKTNINFSCDNLKLFELRPVFLRNDQFVEVLRLSGVIYGAPLSWTEKIRPSDFYDVRGICEGLALHLGLDVSFEKTDEHSFLHPQVAILLNDEKVGYLGMLHPEIAMKWDINGPVGIFDLDWKRWSADDRRCLFKPLTRFPTVRRDISLLVLENILSDDILAAIATFNNEIIRNVTVFDVYRGKGVSDGKKSLTYAIMYGHPDRTLTDKEVNETHQGLVGFIKDKLGAEIR